MKSSSPPLVKGAKLHGGWVKAGRSAQGGAEFTIHLPGASSLDALPQPVRASAPA